MKQKEYKIKCSCGICFKSKSSGTKFCDFCRSKKLKCSCGKNKKNIFVGFCSECLHLKRQEIARNYHKGKTRPKKTGELISKALKGRGKRKPNCINCGIKIAGITAKRCKKCYGLSVRGEKSPNWKGGISRNIHSLKEPQYKNWRNEVFKRDNYKCKISDENCKGQLEAHHILRWADYPELRYNINNGITLCHFHHPRKRKEEKRLSPYFQGLVSVSKDSN